MRMSTYIPILVKIVFTFVEAMIGLRILLKLFGASTAAPFVRWVYATSHPLLAPFEGMFPSPHLTGGFIIEISALFAFLAYAFVEYLVEEFFAFVNEREISSMPEEKEHRRER